MNKLFICSALALLCACVPKSSGDASEDPSEEVSANPSSEPSEEPSTGDYSAFTAVPTIECDHLVPGQTISFEANL